MGCGAWPRERARSCVQVKPGREVLPLAGQDHHVRLAVVGQGREDGGPSLLLKTVALEIALRQGRRNAKSIRNGGYALRVVSAAAILVKATELVA